MGRQSFDAEFDRRLVQELRNALGQAHVDPVAVEDPEETNPQLITDIASVTEAAHAAQPIPPIDPKLTSQSIPSAAPGDDQSTISSIRTIMSGIGGELSNSTVADIRGQLDSADLNQLAARDLETIRAVRSVLDGLTQQLEPPVPIVTPPLPKGKAAAGHAGSQTTSTRKRRTDDEIEKSREEARERKRKIRLDQQNKQKQINLQNRIKDHASAIFGEQDSPQKALWIETELQRQRASETSEFKPLSKQPRMIARNHMVDLLKESEAVLGPQVKQHLAQRDRNVPPHLLLPHPPRPKFKLEKVACELKKEMSPPAEDDSGNLETKLMPIRRWKSGGRLGFPPNLAIVVAHKGTNSTLLGTSVELS